MRIVSLLISFLLFISIVQAQTERSLICPDDIIIGCEILITPDNTGMPTVIGYDNSFFFDTRVQNCPGDLILERSWVAQLGTTISDTCIQLITVNFDSVAPLNIPDTINFSGACIDELPGLLQESFGITCDISINSVDFTINENTCDRINLSAAWVFNAGCADTTFSANQVVIVDNPSVGRFSDPVITVTDSVNMLSSIDIRQLCPGPSLSFIWSNNETSLALNNIPSGTYTLVYANDIGCTDSLTVEVPAVFVNDTMMMDTMMMDTMMMDTMMMDTMMMDTMMMDSTMMDTMMMDTMMMDSMMMDTVMMDTMMMDSMMMDTMMMDIMMMDTMMMDTMMMDTMMMDTMMMDTMMMDTMMTDTMMMDTMMMDSMMMDTMMMDTMMMDTMMMDTMMMDTMMMDTMMMDTMMMDTMMMDTMMMDTMMMDTMMMDTMMMDTTMMDTMMMDTMMTDTMMMDTMMMDTMMMNTMMMDSMMMDTMMMDSMMMDSMMMDSMMMDTMMMDTMMMDSMMMDTMMMDSMMMDTMMMDTMMMDTTSGFVLICPPDTIVSCNSGLDPSLLGMASFTGFDSVRFVDIMIDSCPSDLIIDRQWIASGPEMLDTCIQQISVQRNGFGLINMSDSSTFNGICIDDLLDRSAFDLACGIIIDTIMLDLDSVTCGFANLSRTIAFTDECLDSTIVVTQNVMINELAVARLISQNITGDNGEGNGMIDLTFASCSDSLSFQWSNGATTEDLPRVIQGSYTLVIANELGCTDTLEFFVPAQNPEAFLLQVRDRNNEFIDVNSISVQRATGADINTNIVRLDVGQYQLSATTQTVIRGDQICMEINEPAANDLSVLDVIRGQRHILGLENACEEDLTAGDVNFSGSVTASDLASMQRIILGLSEEYPDSLSWTFVTEGFTPVSVRQEGCIEIEADFFEDQVIEVQAIKLGDYRCER